VQCGYRCSNSNCRTRRIFGRPRRLRRERHRNMIAWISIERIVLVMQSSSRLVGFILRALSFGDAADANQYFAFRFRHPEKVSQQVEVGRDRQGFELGGHGGDVAGDVEHFPRHSPMRRIVGSSRRSRGSALSASPTSGFMSQEAYFLGHPINCPICHCSPYLMRHSFHWEGRTRSFLEGRAIRRGPTRYFMRRRTI
jgi:hypothetical protein